MPSIPRGTASRYALAVAGVALATAARLALDPWLGERFPFLAHFLAIVLSAWYGGAGPSLLAASLSWGSLVGLGLVPRATAPFFSDPLHLTFAFLAVGLAI